MRIQVRTAVVANEKSRQMRVMTKSDHLRRPDLRRPDASSRSPSRSCMSLHHMATSSPTGRGVRGLTRSASCPCRMDSLRLGPLRLTTAPRDNSSPASRDRGLNEGLPVRPHLLRPRRNRQRSSTPQNDRTTQSSRSWTCLPLHSICTMAGVPFHLMHH